MFLWETLLFIWSFFVNLQNFLIRRILLIWTVLLLFFLFWRASLLLYIVLDVFNIHFGIEWKSLFLMSDIWRKFFVFLFQKFFIFIRIKWWNKFVFVRTWLFFKIVCFYRLVRTHLSNLLFLNISFAYNLFFKVTQKHTSFNTKIFISPKSIFTVL